LQSHYKTLIKKYLDSKTDIPPEETIAAELGISVKRLRSALRATQPLLSIDGPLMASAGAVKGSNAGSDVMGGSELLISDTLQCSEARPEDQVELSFLRQCLENAMSAELSPHERDVLRLRLGLDDGVTRSAREVVEVCGGTVSVSEVRLTEQRAFKKLRAPFSLQNYQLIAFLDFAGIDQSSLKR
jgi:DNA-directed RNA polymerase sigma subunit (sigma70/sigma32)